MRGAKELSRKDQKRLIEMGEFAKDYVLSDEGLEDFLNEHPDADRNSVKEYAEWLKDEHLEICMGNKALEILKVNPVKDTQKGIRE